MIANKINAFISEKSESTEIFLLMLQDNCIMEFNQTFDEDTDLFIEKFIEEKKKLIEWTDRML